MKTLTSFLLAFTFLFFHSVSFGQQNPENSGDGSPFGETRINTPEDVQNGISTFPNPVRIKLIVTAQQPDPSDLTFTFYTIYGVNIEEGLITDPKIEIDISTYLPGLYFLIIKGSQFVDIRRIIKE